MPKEPKGPSNQDAQVVEGFGDEWSRFDQQALGNAEKEKIFQDYFAIFPWQSLPANSQGADVGCGSGRWAQLAAPRVGTLHLVDASAQALEVAKRNLAGAPNVVFHHASVDALPFAQGSLDFAYSLGVLHHVPNTPRAIADVASKLKPGAPLLLYLYYAFDNRPWWFKLIWRASDVFRQVISRLPHGLRFLTSQVMAGLVYWPLARSARVLAGLRLLPASFPLAYYRDQPFYVMRTDALDRFGTRLEQRFTRQQIARMMADAGLENIRFSDGLPFWCAVGTKKPSSR